MKVYTLLFEFLRVQENARITQARTNVLVILDTVGPIALLTLTNVNLHHADTVKCLFRFSTKASWQFRHKNDSFKGEI